MKQVQAWPLEFLSLQAGALVTQKYDSIYFQMKIWFCPYQSILNAQRVTCDTQGL